MSEHDAVDNAWKIHSSIVDWTGKVDTKASFSLTIEAAIIGAVVTLSTADRALTSLRGFAKFLNVAGVVLLIVAIVLAALVVKPRLRRKHAEGESPENYIYFGHAKFWKPEDLEVALRERDILPILTRQIVVMSRIAWTKHQRVRWSVPIAGVGAALEAWAALIGPR